MDGPYKDLSVTLPGVGGPYNDPSVSLPRVGRPYKDLSVTLPGVGGPYKDPSVTLPRVGRPYKDLTWGWVNLGDLWGVEYGRFRIRDVDSLLPRDEPPSA